MEPMTPDVDLYRRRLLAAGVTGAAAGLAGWSPASLAQAAGAKPRSKPAADARAARPERLQGGHQG
jgi:hypothetical protein